MKIGPFTKVVIFITVIVIFFVFLGASVPQGEQAAGGMIEWDRLSQEELILHGQRIFNSKGTCYNCHSVKPGVEGRCPNLSDIGRTASTRKPGMTGEQYLAESLYDPTIYVVKGFGPIMPPVYGPPMVLADPEIKAIIAFLQNQGGTVTVDSSKPLTYDTARYAQAREAAKKPVTGNPHKGEEVFFNTARCIACHKVGTLGGVLGPELTSIGAFNSPDYLRESMVEPNAKIVRGFEKDVMPQTFKDHLSGEQIEDVVAYLLTLRGQSK